MSVWRVEDECSMSGSGRGKQKPENADEENIKTREAAGCSIYGGCVYCQARWHIPPKLDGSSAASQTAKGTGGEEVAAFICRQKNI